MFIVYIAAGIIIGFILKSLMSGKRVQEQMLDMDSRLDELKKNTRKQLEEKEREFEEEKIRIKENIEKQNSGLRRELEEKRRDIDERTQTLERKADVIETKEAEIITREKELEELRENYEAQEKIVNDIRQKEKSMLEEISRMSPKEAREKLMKRVEEEAKEEAHRNYTRIVENARRDAKRESVEILAQAVQRNASDVTQDLTVSTVSLPDDDMKGRIIGREGRNIRALEAATGVNIIIDDTPGVITISSYDGVRRETAKRSLEILIKDGRIQPVRIEEVVGRVKKEVDEIIRKAGEEAALQAGVTSLRDEEILLLGKLKYRTSYGQNVLQHAVEVARLAGIMADELGIDTTFTRRAGLLHDLGKAVDREMEGSHVELGVKLAKKYGESERLLNAIQAHHEDVVADTAEAVLIQAADTISASRPGARRESLEYYVKRLNEIEDIARGFEGVKDAFCVSAGREIIIMVEPDKVSDLEAANLAKNCARNIEKQIDYPGEIKVTVVRNMKSTEIAH